MDIITLTWIEFFVLVCGTIFAWHQWYLVLKRGTKTCSAIVDENPYKSKCFYGALFFTAALIINIFSISIL